MKTISRLPAIPLFTHDPFFSIWDCGKTPTADDTHHWTGAEKFFKGTLTVDGIIMRFLGRGGRHSMKCVATEITPLSSRYVYESMGVRLTVTYTSPLLLDDLDILSTPISYVRFQVEHTDGQAHHVILRFQAGENNCYCGGNAPAMRVDFFQDGDLRFGYMGQKRQAPLSASGDLQSIDWGYQLFCSDTGSLDDLPGVSSNNLRYNYESSEPFSTTLMVGYDDIASINYFGRMLPAYYARNGKTIIEALKEFHNRQDEIIARCDAFDAQLLQDAYELGGDNYAAIVVASYRQSIAAHKLVADEEGKLLFISKENHSNGCAATVDVSYPSVPLYLLYCPELVRAMCRPIMKFCKMPVWHYDFAPHDVGRYPVLNGQIYAAYLRAKNHSEGNTVAPYYYYPASVDAYTHTKQMPVEECGNMLLMMAAVGYADGDWSMAETDLSILRMWSQYLLTYGEDPGEQLCTDDFAGHLARNINLSAKAVMGIAAFSMILEALGHKEEADEYMAKAKAMGVSWLERASAGDYTYLTFNGDGWSQKYNLVWDKLFGWNILPDEFYRKELASYLPRINEYGLPLDSRAPYTKSDWTMWVAAMADDRQTLDALTAPIAKFLQDSTCRVPFSDFYDTEEAIVESFFARSVQGGCFMPLLMKKWTENRK